MKKIIAFLLATALLVCGTFNDSSSLKAYAKAKVWDGTADTSWYKEGTTTFNISTPEQLAGLSVLVDGGNTFGGVTINLTKDIYLNSNASECKKWVKTAPKNVWDPIGGISSWVKERHFDGVFNGNGHSIIGMYVNCGHKPGGLFSVTQKAAIVNLKFKNCVIVPYDSSYGMITGESYYSYIANCEAENVLIYENDDRTGGNASVGTLVGSSPVNYSGASVFMAFMAMGLVVNPLIIGAVEGDQPYNGTVITDCKVNEFTLKCGTNNGKSKVGGVIGCADNGAFLYNCLVMNGSISAEDKDKKGESVVGVLHAGGKGEINNCYFHNVKTKYAATKYGANKFLKKVSKKVLTGQAFVKKIGSQYKAVSGEAPALKTVKAK